MTELNTGSPILDAIVLIVVPAFVGSFSSDYIKTLQGKYLTVKAGRVFASGAFASFFSYSILYNLFIGKGFTNALMFTAFAIGLVAFELVQHMVSLEGWVSLLRKFNRIAIPLLDMANILYEIKRGCRDTRQETSDCENKPLGGAVEKTTAENITDSHMGGSNHDI